jgi:beta-N-acetylhexosaminidase
MLSHARLTPLDAERPVSFSETIVSGLLRGWDQEGVLVTDDLGMGAVYGSRPASPRPASRRSMPGST